jgi:hypothetical protein
MHQRKKVYHGLGSRSGSQLVSVNGRLCNRYTRSAEDRSLRLGLLPSLRQTTPVPVDMACPDALDLKAMLS